MSVLTHKNIFD